MKSICVFLGANMGASPVYADAIKQLATELVKRNITCIYGGANAGLMKLLADTILKKGGHIIGVTVKALHDKEVFHTDLAELHITHSMQERKMMMAELSDGFITFPGGLGTFDEFFEMYTWKKLGLHDKPCALLNVNNYFAPMIQMLDHAEEEGFMRATDKNLLIHSHCVSDVLDQMLASR